MRKGSECTSLYPGKAVVLEVYRWLNAVDGCRRSDRIAIDPLRSIAPLDQAGEARI